MSEGNYTKNQLDNLIDEMNYDMNLLVASSNGYAFNVILNHLKDQISIFESLINKSQVLFTLEELSRYNGENGAPAYVAVNGTVYDVTNNDAWRGATHYDLKAGKDFSAEFNFHHGDSARLNQLPIVGRLI